MCMSCVLCAVQQCTCSTTTDQQGQHLQHGDLGIDQVRQEVDEGGNTEPVPETCSYRSTHQSTLPLKYTQEPRV